MIHRAFRSLNDPVKLLGFTVLQWVALLGAGGVTVGATQLLGLPTRPAISLCTLVVTTVGALAFATEPGGTSPITLLTDVVRWRCTAKRHAPRAGPAPARPAYGLLIQGEDPATTAHTHVDRAEEVFAL